MIAQKPKIAILILAAGESKRMGKRVKQLLSWKKTTLIENALAEANNSQAEDSFVVLGANKEQIKKQANLPDKICIYNKNWQNGMGSSIAAGIKYILKLEKVYDGVLVMLVDQPLIDADYLNLILDTWGGANTAITATTYENGLGVPAMFTKNYFEELLKLTKDLGAKTIINNSATTKINPKGKELDIDTWQEYKELVIHEQKII